MIERKIEFNGLIIKARWFYASAILVLGLYTKFFSYSSVNFPLVTMAILYLFYIAINFIFYLYLQYIKKDKSAINLEILSWWQVGSELIALTLIMHYTGGAESIIHFFYFFSIVSAALIFGLRGSLSTSILSSLLVNGLVLAEYYKIIPHAGRFNVPTVDYLVLSVGLAKSITISTAFIIVAILSGYGINMLFRREELLGEQTQKLNAETEKRLHELKQLDRTAKLLVKRDSELNRTIKALEKEKEKSEDEKYKTLAIISNFSDPIIVLDNENKLAIYNHASKEILGVKFSDIGKKVLDGNDFSLDKFKTIISADFNYAKSVEENNNNLGIEEMDLKIQNEARYYKVITSEVRGDDDEYLGVMKIFYDLTREKTIDKMKSEFITVAAHQLRTPLAAIKWSIDLVIKENKGKIDAEQIDLLKKGYKSNERMIKLVDDLLNVSRIEEGRFGYNFNNYKFADILEIAVENLEATIKKKKIKLIIEKNQELPRVYIDKDKIGMVMQNLLDNAVKYTPLGGKIELTFKTAGDRFYVSIKDSGIGIPPKDQEKLFSKFFRSDKVLRMETEGTGLGLFIAKNIIIKHGGSISFSSEEGKGSEFIFDISLSK